MNVQANQIQQLNPDDYAQAQTDMQKAKRMQALADSLGNQQYGATTADAIAALVNGYTRAKTNKQADETWSSAYERAGQYETQEKERAAKSAAEAEARKRAQSMEDYESKKRIDQQYAKPDASSNEKLFSMENNLRGNFIKETGDFAKQNDAFGRVAASAKDPSPAGDMALIFNYMKMLDPGSTVREGEFASAQNSGSVDQIVRAKYNSILEGTRLSPEQRYDFVKRSASLYDQAKQDYGKRVSAHKGLAGQYSEYGVNPERVTFGRDLYNTDEIMSGFQAPQAGGDRKPQPSMGENPSVVRMKDANGNIVSAAAIEGQWVNAATGEPL